MELKDIVNLKAVTSRDSSELQLIKAVIEEKVHYTADIRKMFSGNWYAVFSNNTEYNKILHSGVDLCISEGIYLEHDIESISLQVDHYIWVEVDFKGLEFKR